MGSSSLVNTYFVRVMTIILGPCAYLAGMIMSLSNESVLWRWLAFGIFIALAISTFLFHICWTLYLYQVDTLIDELHKKDPVDNENHQ